MCHFHFVQFSAHRKGTSSVCSEERAKKKIKNLYVFNLFYANHILHNYCCVLHTRRKNTEKNCVCDLYSWFKIRSFLLLVCLFELPNVKLAVFLFPEYYVVCGSGIGTKREVWKMHASNVHIFDFFTFHIFITTTWRL